MTTRFGRPPRIPGELTGHELRVLERTALGEPESVVARKLTISVWSVKNALRGARRSLDAANTVHLVAIAIGRGLLPSDIAVRKSDAGEPSKSHPAV